MKMRTDLQKMGKTALRIRHDLVRRHRDVLDEHPTEQYIKLLYNRPKMASYTYICPELRRLSDNILRRSERSVLQLYHKLIILSLIDKNRTKLRAMNLPRSIKDLYMKAFEIITREIGLNPDEFYQYSNDKFRKDLNLCALNLIPIGPAVIELSPVPKWFLFKKGLGQFVKGLFFIAFQVGGFKPLYQGHLYLRGLADYNRDEWDRAYRRLADLLKIEATVKGYFGYGWYFDPQIETISPKLAYKRRRIEDNGGGIFYVGSTPEDKKDATLKSPTRRKLYEEGKYTPTKYMFVWPRRQLMNWAHKISFY
jgi:hypothetical protein